MKKYFTNKNFLAAFAVLAITAGLYVGFAHFSTVQTTETTETQTSNSDDQNVVNSAPEQKATITLPTVNVQPEVESNKVDPSTTTDETIDKAPAADEKATTTNSYNNDN